MFDKKEQALMQARGVRLLKLGCPDYPAWLQNISNPPSLLYCRGNLLPRDEQAVAIVGSRTCSHYGKTVARRLAQELAQRGWTILSGLAYGIDTAAHRGALDGGGRTLALLGHGLGAPLFPPENEPLAEEIAANGAVLSEFPMTFSPQPRNFPRRNRIIAGLSRGVVVVEAAFKSGALITADFALEQGKPVLAVPGRIDLPTSEGPNRLIQQGARLVLSVRDIIEELGGNVGGEPETRQLELNSRLEEKLSNEEKMILSRLSAEEKQLEILLEEIPLSAAEAAQTLFSLEIKNLVKQHPGQYYVKL